MAYEVDLRDVKFQLLEWLPMDELLSSERFADWDRENLEMVVDEALKIAREQLATGNEEGDREGAVWKDGAVTVPASFKTAYRTVAEGGWVGCINSPEYGGMGLPHTVGTVINEFFAGANLSLSLTFLLTRGAAELIENFGTDELQSLYCEKMYSGKWGGTMCLTEPHAGSDVGASTTRAVKQDNGSYRITGEKIFITFGEHDLTDNIVHAVLARTPGAPEGTKGLSLFVVPKIRVNSDGSLGEPNDVVCGSIEHKLGIHGSPTCSILFGQNDGCEGYLLGEENQGMPLMFQMMNSARIEVGLEGAAIGGATHQAALAYARERVQGRHWNRKRGAELGGGGVPLVEHPDIRRMLLGASAFVQAMRALLLQTSFFIDKSHVADGEEKERAQSYVEVLTPICKAWASDWGFRVAEWCLQVYGGYGYTRDYPAEQYLRDVKIASIYEGTNGIQALDLVGRKLPARGGKPAGELLAMVASTVKSAAASPRLASSASLLGTALREVREVLDTLPKRPDALPLTLLNAVPTLHMLGHVLGAHFLLDQAVLAETRLAAILEGKKVDAGDAAAYATLLADDSEAVFFHNKIQAAIHFSHRALPEVTALAAPIKAAETAPLDAVM